MWNSIEEANRSTTRMSDKTGSSSKQETTFDKRLMQWWERYWPSPTLRWSNPYLADHLVRCLVQLHRAVCTRGKQTEFPERNYYQPWSMAMEKRSPFHRWDYSYHVVTKIDENVPDTLYIISSEVLYLPTLFVETCFRNFKRDLE